MARKAVKAATEAGMRRDDGQEPPIHVNRWYVPDLFEVDGDRLRWRIDERAPKWRQCQPGARMLDAFIALATARDERILAFARTHGQLFVPDPEQNEPECWLCVGEGDDRSGPVFTAGTTWPGHQHRSGSEPLEAWRALASDAKLAHNIAAKLYSGEPVPAKWWAEFRCFDAIVKSPIESGLIEFDPSFDDAKYFSRTLTWEPRDCPVPFTWQGRGSKLMTAGQVIARFVNEWVRTAVPMFQLSWDNARSAPPRTKLVAGPSNLLGALGVQLAQTIARTGGLAWCCECGESYQTSRKPRAGQDAYCGCTGGAYATRTASRSGSQRSADRSNSARRSVVREWNKLHPEQSYFTASGLPSVTAYREAFADGLVDRPLP